VIARDHRDANTARVTLLDGLDRLLARRIEKADQTKKDKVLGQIAGAETAGFQFWILEPRQS
jgi:hypothetical protein